MALVENRAPMELFQNSIKVDFLNSLSDDQIQETIVAVFDTGIAYNCISFNDLGLVAPPLRWIDRNVISNKVLCASAIGGVDGYDFSGHGTMCAAIAAGREVDFKYFGAESSTFGVLPEARLASYRVTKSDALHNDEYLYQSVYEYESVLPELLDMVNSARKNGVNVISISLISTYKITNAELQGRFSFYTDMVSLIALEASVRYGSILCVGAAGNDADDGEEEIILNTGIVENLAPWVLTVGASTASTVIVTKVLLRDKITEETFEIKGYNFNTRGTRNYFALISHTSVFKEDHHGNRKVDKTKVSNKIVVCESTVKDVDLKAIMESNACGVILMQGYICYMAMNEKLPYARVSGNDRKVLENFMKNREAAAATAKIYRSLTEEATKEHYPNVARFSGRGPNRISDYIMKPDLCAPGVYVMTATINSNYELFSGTSAAVPIVSSIAARVKARYPGFSPAAVKSALMTTADSMNNVYNNELEYLGMGAGLVNPVKALNPGLIYDISLEQWLKWNIGDIEDWNLNLPSFAAKLEKGQCFTFERELINFNGGPCTYKAKVVKKEGLLNAHVQPDILEFSTQEEKQFFILKVTVKKWACRNWRRAIVAYDLVWEAEGGEQSVRSPILITNWSPE